MKSDVVIIGGGIAGLAAGALLAKSGRKAIVLEKGNQPGGRAYTYNEKGFTLNYGPHALYLPDTGTMGEILRRLGRPGLRYNTPDPIRSYWAEGARFASMGAKPHQLLTTKLFPFLTRLQVASFMLAIRSAKPDELGDMTYGEWLDNKTKDPLVRSFGRAFGTVNSYTRPSAALSARFLIGHVQRTLFAKDYVAYISDGWIQFYGAFIEELRAGGGELITGARVDDVEVNDGRIVAAIANGERYEADAFICTLPPQEAPSIINGASPLAMELAHWSSLEDVRATCIDLGFSRRLRDDLTFVYDIERDLYYSLHSEVTPDLAPEGGQLLHAMAYLSPEEASDPKAGEERRRELEAGLDRYFAGWREAAVVHRVLPNTRVASARRTPGQFAERAMPLRAASVGNLYFAGDARDLAMSLGECSLASAMEAADAIVRDVVPSAAAPREAAIA